jgi:hypothetical protein
MKKAWILALGFFMVVCLSPPAETAVIFDNGAPNLRNFGAEMTVQLLADDFVLDTRSSLTGITFWASTPATDDGFQGSVPWLIYDNSFNTVGNYNQPGNLLHSGTASSVDRTLVTTVSGRNLYKHDFLVDPISLNGGTTYWLALHNGPLNYTTFETYVWATTADPSINTTNLNLSDGSLPLGNGPWTNPTSQLAFQLSGGPVVVPLPGSVWLFGFGLAILAHLRHKSLL